jgi:hypothetical protein
MKRTVTMGVTLFALLGAVWGIADDIGIPQALSMFRTWKKLTSEPQLVPYVVATACAIPTPAETLKRHGLHANRWIMVYANPVASAALADNGGAQFPVGAIIAKEKTTGSGATEGVAFMVKHRAGEFAASDGWEFLYYPVSGRAANYDGCINCHKSGGKKDYVFAAYGPYSIRQ